VKRRNGFVSNSSSSSFIVLKKDKNMSFDEMKAKSIEVLTSHCDYRDDGEYERGEAERYAKDNRRILLIENVEWGGEEAINKIVPKLLEKLGVNTEDISFEWGE